MILTLIIFLLFKELISIRLLFISVRCTSLFFSAVVLSVMLSDIENDDAGTIFAETVAVAVAASASKMTEVNPIINKVFLDKLFVIVTCIGGFIRFLKCFLKRL